MKIMTEWDVTREKDMQNLEGRKVLCPFIHEPFEECYCASTSSLYAEATIRYCGGDFKDCAIYLKHSADRTCLQ